MDELHEKFLNDLDINIEKIKIQENLFNFNPFFSYVPNQVK